MTALVCLLVTGAAFLCFRLDRGKRGIDATQRTVIINLAESGGGDGTPPSPPPPPPLGTVNGNGAEGMPNASTPDPAVKPLPPEGAVVPVPSPSPVPAAGSQGPSGDPSGVPGGVVGGTRGGSLGGIPGGTQGSNGVGRGLGSGAGSGGTLDVPFATLKIRFQPNAPVYPRLAKVSHIQGVVQVVLTIGPDGVPTHCEVRDGPPTLRDAALEFAMQWRFEPYLVEGVARTVRLPMAIPFSLR